MCLDIWDLEILLYALDLDILPTLFLDTHKSG